MGSLVKWGNWKFIGILFVICYVIGIIGWELDEPSSLSLRRCISLFSFSSWKQAFKITQSLDSWSCGS